MRSVTAVPCKQLCPAAKMYAFVLHECTHLIGTKPCIRVLRKPAFHQHESGENISRTLGWLAFVLVGKDNSITTKLKELKSNRFETAGIYFRQQVAIEEAGHHGLHQRNRAQAYDSGVLPADNERRAG